MRMIVDQLPSSSPQDLRISSSSPRVVWPAVKMKDKWPWRFVNEILEWKREWDWDFSVGQKVRERKGREKERKRGKSCETEWGRFCLKRRVVGNMRCERSVFDSLTKSGGWRQGWDRSIKRKILSGRERERGEKEKEEEVEWCRQEVYDLNQTLLRLRLNWTYSVISWFNQHFSFHHSLSFFSIFLLSYSFHLLFNSLFLLSLTFSLSSPHLFLLRGLFFPAHNDQKS